jgi:hypothetical protein
VPRDSIEFLGSQKLLLEGRLIVGN